MRIPASVQLHTNQADECFMRIGDKSKKLNFDERMQLLYDKGERYYEDKDVYGQDSPIPQSIQVCQGVWRGY